MRAFDFNGIPSRVLFGAGRTAELPAEIARLGVRRPMIITTPEQEASGQALATLVGDATLYPGAVMHTPVEVTEKALSDLKAQTADCLVAIGGGSSIGLAKALALRTGLPQIAIPTTYAGSEVTDILGQSEAGVKTTQRAPVIRPTTVIYDVVHTLSLPPRLSASSGLNAIAHAVEALWAHDGNPIVDLMAKDGIRALVRSLPAIAADPRDLEARSDAQYGAWLCGVCLGSVSMALHHKLAHVLGGTFNLPHAETHAILLPYSLAYNSASTPDAMKAIGDAVGDSRPAWEVFQELLDTFGLPRSLSSIGMPADGIDRAVELAMSNTYPNPRPLSEDPLRRLFTAALHGYEPQA